MRLQGRVALVIGGASGLGRASAECCAKDGARVVIADVNEAGATAVVEGVRAGGGQALFVRTDAGDEVQVKAAIAATVAEFGTLDILINSAGAGRPATADGWHFAIDHFLKGPYYACRHALPEMEKNGGGVIINVASLAGVTGVPVERIEDSGYSCAKHGVIGLTRTLALAYAKKNIRVNAICPGYIKTGLTQSLYEGADGGQSLISEKLRIPMDRWGEAREIGTVAAFLASDDASFITGQPIIVDGGFMAR